jgi:hypothetical protein
MHEHCHCDHDLKYCEKCKVVFCKKCGQEWYENSIHIYPNITPAVTYRWDYTTTTVGDWDSSKMICNHN